MINIEYKIKTPGHAQILSDLRKLHARKISTSHQVDTYFLGAKGRLKLRDIDGKRFELIQYTRANKTASRASNYVFIPLQKNQAQKIQLMCLHAFGNKTLIVKKRRVRYMYKHTRIHVDTVNRLGTFVELETVVKGITQMQARQEQDGVKRALHVSQYKALAGSYSDVMKKI